MWFTVSLFVIDERKNIIKRCKIERKKLKIRVKFVF